MAKVYAKVDLQTDSTLRLFNTASTHFVALKAPTAQAADITFIVPGTDVASGVISSNGSGTLAVATLINANVSATAAIAVTKLAALTASRAVVTDGSGFISASAATATEVGYLSGVTSALQTQLDSITSTASSLATTVSGKAGTALDNLTVSSLATGDLLVASSATALARLAIGSSGQFLSSNGTTAVWSSALAVNKIAALTASRGVVTDGSGFISAATTTATEIGYVNGVTSAIQTQLDAKLACTSQVSISSSTTLTTRAIHLVSTAAARSLTLPAPATSVILVVKDVTGSCSTNNITIVRNGSEKIEGTAASYVLSSDFVSVTFVSDGTDWFAI